MKNIKKKGILTTLFSIIFFFSFTTVVFAGTCSTPVELPVNVNIRIEKINSTTRALLRITNSKTDELYVADAKTFAGDSLDLGSYTFTIGGGKYGGYGTRSLTYSISVNKATNVAVINGKSYQLDGGGQVEGLDFPEAWVDPGLIPVGRSYITNFANAKRDIGLDDKSISGTMLNLTSKYGNTGTAGLAMTITFWERVGDNMYNTQVAPKTIKVIYKYTELEGRGTVPNNQGGEASVGDLGFTGVQYFQQFNTVENYAKRETYADWVRIDRISDHTCYVSRKKAKESLNCTKFSEQIINIDSPKFYQEARQVGIDKEVTKLIIRYETTCKSKRDPTGPDKIFINDVYPNKCGDSNEYFHVSTKDISYKETYITTEWRSEYRNCEYTITDNSAPYLKEGRNPLYDKVKNLDVRYCKSREYKDRYTGVMFDSYIEKMPVLSFPRVQVVKIDEKPIEAAFESVIQTISPPIGQLTERDIDKRAQTYAQGQIEKSTFDEALRQEISARGSDGQFTDMPAYANLNNTVRTTTYNEAGKFNSSYAYKAHMEKFYSMDMYGVYLYAIGHWRAIDMTVDKTMNGGTASIWERVDVNYECNEGKPVNPEPPITDPEGQEIETSVSLSDFEYIKVLFEEFKENNPRLSGKELSVAFYDYAKADSSKASRKLVEYIDFRITTGDDIHNGLNKFFEMFYLN